MTHSARRRSILLAGMAAPLAMVSRTSLAASVESELAALESTSQGRLGVFALDTRRAHQIRHRADERFPLCSTFKVALAAGILHRSATEPGLLERLVRYTAADLVTYSPITEKRLAEGMSVGALCVAAMQYSDNAAANLLMKELGGPAGVTAFARAQGDTVFRIDRWEPELNTAVPGDARDTSSPAAMGMLLHRFALGTALPAAQRGQLIEWLRGNTTGAARIRAGVPKDWIVGDKTGSGDYGTTNDVGILWRPDGSAVVLAVYFTQPRKDAEARSDVVAAAARIVAKGLDPA
ncbi:class A beta-lactamase [Uliginosibacterium sp. sgz301328]|uniref:class A beta-lactamase n=1 Tax=Uliginosibacterium sp. sgz301328 TaxID=3243764 RepID=UPI00359E8DC0